MDSKCKEAALLQLVSAAELLGGQVCKNRPLPLTDRLAKSVHYIVHWSWTVAEQ